MKQLDRVQLLTDKYMNDGIKKGDIGHRNLTMLTDFYELTMGGGYFDAGLADTVAHFDLFFREVPDGGGFAIMAGLESVIDYLSNLHFSSDDIEYLRGRKIFSEEFLSYLKNFKFACDVWSVPEGTVIFPGEPILRVKGPIIQAQFIETALLMFINHQSLIATKANRIVRAAQGRAVMEFGSRRAQGADAAHYGARAAYIAGCAGTACTISDITFGVPALGTMAHSWVQTFDSELDAFKTYAAKYPNACTLLVDTYNVLKSGIPNAIRAFDEILKPLGIEAGGVRIDSGDISYLAKKARKMLNDAGYPDIKIVASNSLDEYIIRELLINNAPVDSFGVGERLITASSSPMFGGVYKLAAIDRPDGNNKNKTIHVPKIKLSENVSKLTTPGAKSLWRLYDRESGKAIADVVTLEDEIIGDSAPYEIFSPRYTWKRKVCENFRANRILCQIFDKGNLIYNQPTLTEVRAHCARSVDTLWDEVTRFENPHEYYVDLSQDLWDLRDRLIKENSAKYK